MNLLLDTHTVVWWLNDSPRLGSTVRTAIAKADAIVFVSAASGWEIATKARRGRWPEADALMAYFQGILARNRLVVLPISMRHAVPAGKLPGTHGDRFDRILAAQAELEQLTLATVDPAFVAFGTHTLW